MARWEPDAQGRLEQAAMELFIERGYVGATVEDIAHRAGLTERTFFRYFSDKREVLFSGSKALEKDIVARIVNAASEIAPLETVCASFATAGEELESRRALPYVRARYALVMQHAEIHERELIKLAALAAATTKALRARGVAEPAASLIAEAGIAVFKIGFDRWIKEKKPRDLAGHIRGAMETLKAVAVATPPRTTRANKPAPRRTSA
jgi:AcrR family transcriptional regulator